MLASLRVVLLCLCALVGVSLAAPSPYTSTPINIAPCSSSSVYQNWTVSGTPAPANTTIYLFLTKPWCLDTAKPAAQPHTWACNPTQPLVNQVWDVQANGLLRWTADGGNECAAAVALEPFSGFYLQPCDASDPRQLWQYDAATGHFVLVHTSLTPGPTLCLDAGTTSNVSCATWPTAGNLYCDPSQPAAARAKDLVSRWTLLEKQANLGNQNPGVSRLGAKPVGFGEALHGVAHNCLEAPDGSWVCTTSFPHALLMSQAFNESLWRMVGTAIGTEGRAYYNVAPDNLIFWAPDINLFRDPRWGRGQEVPGEDPGLTGRYVTAYANGLQFGSDTRYRRAVSTAKHFWGYDQEGNQPGTVDRGAFTAVITASDAVEYYLPAWRAAIQSGRVGSIMCSYNAVAVAGGTAYPSCGSPLSMSTIARDQWDFEGFFVSDCGAVNDAAFSAFVNSQFSNVSAANRSDYRVLQAMAIGGLDVNCGQYLQSHTAQAVQDGVVPESTLDTSLERLWATVMELGLMDDNVTSPYDSYGLADIDTPAHRQLALEAARQGIVLLKNANGVLPLAPGTKVAVLGPHMNATLDMLSNYHGQNNLVRRHSPLQVLSSRGVVAASAPGCDLGSNDTSGFAAAVAAGRKGSVSLVFVGLHPSRDGPPAAIEAEAWDRAALTLPGVQEQLIEALVNDGQTVVVVLIHGGPLAIETTQTIAHAIVDAKYPGELGGDAIADVVFGIVSPAGRLTSTVYPANFTTARPHIGDMQLRPHDGVPGVTYKWYDTPLWEFGFGLSYTTFSFQPVGLAATHVSMPVSAMAGRDAAEQAPGGTHATFGAAVGPDYVVNVTNTGTVSSDVVVLGFVSSTAAGQPLRELFGFQRVANLAPGASSIVYLTVPPSVVASAVSTPDGGTALAVHAGEWSVQIGDGDHPFVGRLSLVADDDGGGGGGGGHHPLFTLPSPM